LAIALNTVGVNNDTQGVELLDKAFALPIIVSNPAHAQKAMT
jgi:hypothetical protein